MKFIFSTLILFGLLVPALHAAPVFTDSFADASNWAPYAGNNHVISVSEGVLSLSRSATNAHVDLSTTFDSVSLNVGDVLTFEFRTRQSGDNGTSNRNNEFRFSFGNSNGTAGVADDIGYGVSLGHRSGTSLLGRDAGSANALGYGADFTELVSLTGYALQPDMTEFVDIRVVATRTATGLDFDVTRNGTSLFQATDNAPITTTFDMIAFGYYNRSVEGTLDLDSMSLTYTAIPEPGTYAAIFGLMAMALLVWRRRK